MIKITVDDALRARLADFEERIELCDEAGKTVGFFVPAAEAQRLWYDWAREQFTEDEIDAARNEAGGFSIDQVLADLQDR